MNYDLNTDLYRTRYFYPHEDPAKLLKEVRRFVKDNPQVNVRNIDISLGYIREGDEITDQWSAHVEYMGTVEENV